MDLHSFDVDGTQSDPLSDLCILIQCNDRRNGRINGESVSAVVHHWSVVVLSSEQSDDVFAEFHEVVLVACTQRSAR